MPLLHIDILSAFQGSVDLRWFWTDRVKSDYIEKPSGRPNVCGTFASSGITSVKLFYSRPTAHDNDIGLKYFFGKISANKFLDHGIHDYILQLLIIVYRIGK